jgi:hypothetical protein
MSVITGVSWIWLGATFPDLKSLIDPDTENFQKLQEWTKVKLALAWFWKEKGQPENICYD